MGHPGGLGGGPAHRPTVTRLLLLFVIPFLGGLLIALLVLRALEAWGGAAPLP